jgi:hypothetical protein
MAGTQMMCPRRCRCSKPNEQVSVLFWSMYTHIIIKELKCVLRLCTCLFHNTTTVVCMCAPRPANVHYANVICSM